MQLLWRMPGTEFGSLSTTCCKDVMRRHGGRLCIHVMSIETGITDTEISWSEAVPLDNFPECSLSAAALPKMQERNRCHLLTRANGGCGMQMPLRSRFRMRAIDDDTTLPHHVACAMQVRLLPVPPLDPSIQETIERIERKRADLENQMFQQAFRHQCILTPESRGLVARLAQR